MANSKTLKTGFTGELQDENSAVETARKVAGYVKDEAGAVARTAKDHPSATSTALLVFGAVAFAAGYLMGASSGSHVARRRFW